MPRRLLERPQEGVLPLVQLRRVVDDDDATAALERPERQIGPDLADLVDPDELPVRGARDDADVGMDALLDLAARDAGAAAAGDTALALKRLRKAQRDRALPDGARSVETVGVGDVALDRPRAEPSEETTLPDDITQ